MILENDDANAKEGDLIDFGRYVQDLGSDTSESNYDYVMDLMRTIMESAASTDSFSLNNNNAHLYICTDTLCLPYLDTSILAEFEAAFACFKDDSGSECWEDAEYYLEIINGFITDDPDTWGTYALWRFGGSAISALAAYNAYIYIIEPQLEARDSVLQSFAYVGDGYFTFPDATPPLDWDLTAIAWYGDDCPDYEMVYCVGYDATGGYSSGSGDIDADVAMFRQYMSAGSTYYSMPTEAQQLINILEGLGSDEEISQAVDAYRAAIYLQAHWGEYNEGTYANFAEIEMALGYTANTQNVPLVTDERLRYALSYALFNKACLLYTSPSPRDA